MKVFILFLTQLFFISILSTSPSPQCTLTLICFKSCDPLKLKDGSNNNDDTSITSINLSINEENSNYIKYVNTFDCQPGDSISLKSHNTDSNDNKVGIKCDLEISHKSDNTNIVYTTNDPSADNIFECSPSTPGISCTIFSETLEGTSYDIYGIQNIGNIDIVIKIPYKFSISENPKTVNNIFDSYQINFEELFVPELINAQTNGRIKVKITQLPSCISDNSHHGKLLKGSDELVIGAEVSFEDSIIFKPNDQNQYGLYNIKYRIISMNQEIETDYEIKINACYQYCNECNEYVSSSSNDFKCTTCKSEQTFFVDDSENTDNHRCYSLAEIQSNYINYYLNEEGSTPIYKKCHDVCRKCQTSQNLCTECAPNHYFVEDFGGTDGPNCFDLYTIETNYPSYYLDIPPSGTTYRLCHESCQKCVKESTNCLSCNNGFHFFEGRGNECIDINNENIQNYLFHADSDTYMKCDKSCKGCTNHKKFCIDCADNYFKIDGQANYCYLEEELYYSFEQKYFKDGNVYKPCDDNCFTCFGSAENCTKCKEGFKLVIDDQDFSKTCKSLNEILNNNYFLLKGEEYYHSCDANCKTCQFTKTNCTSCNTPPYLIEDINKCAEANSAEVKGYYLYDNSVFKKCNYTCKACDSIDQCTECAPPYYLIVLGEGKAKCITQQKKKEQYKNYYLKETSADGTSTFKFERCDAQCLTCEDGVDGTNCIECSEYYVFFEDGGKKCVQKDTRAINVNGNDYHYYFNEELNELRKCHISCDTCKDGKVNNNCYKCNSDYVFIDDNTKGNCVLRTLFTTTLKNYYIVNVNDHKLRDETTTTVDVYKKCPEECEECISYNIDPIMCKKCNMEKGYYKHNSPIDSDNDEKCYKDTLVENKYFNGEEYKPSSEKCKKSTYDNFIKDSCYECHNKLGYYSLDRERKTCENIIPLDHYLSENNIIKRCAFECSSCSEGPTETSTNCDQCKEEYPPSPSNPKNCIFKCPFYYYEYFGNKYCTGESECPSLAPYLIPEKIKCVSSCPHVHYYGVCYDTCPTRTSINNIDNIYNYKKCTDTNNICTVSKFYKIREHLRELSENDDSIKKKVKKYKKYFSYTTNHVDVYQHYLNEYTMYIYQNHECVNELLSDAISLDFSNCISLYNNIVIVLFVVPRQNLYGKIYYKLYQLDGSNNPTLLINHNDYYCSYLRLEIPATQANLDIKKYKDLYNLGVDLSKLDDRFFYDICFQYYEHNKDVVINKRINEYYQDPYKICQDYCTWNKPNFKYDRAVCECYAYHYSLSTANLDYDNNYQPPAFYSSKNIGVLEPLECFTKNFDDLQIFKNMGSYIIAFITLIEIVSIGFYLYNGIELINSYVVDLVKRNPPKKVTIMNKNDINNENDLDKESNKNTELNSLATKKRKRNKKSNNNYISNQNIKINNYHGADNVLIGRTNNLNYQKINKEKDFQANLKYKGDANLNTNKNINIINTENKKDDMSLINSSIEPKKPSSFDRYVHTFTDYELNSMELYDAIIKDKRSFCYFFMLQMKSKQEFYKTFCMYEPLYPFSIKIISYLFILSLNLVFNALLYTEDQIYEGTESMTKNITNIFLRAFYSFVIVECIYYVVNCLLKNANYLKSLVYRVKKEKQLRVEAYQSIKHIKVNFGVFFFIVIICEILFWVYLSSFCYCYHGEQIELFSGFLVTQAYIEIFCIPLALYLTIFRFIGLKCKATTCYKISQTFLDN